MKDNQELLDLMVQDQYNQKDIYLPGDYWKGYQKRVVHGIQQYGISNFRNYAEIGKGYADTITKDPLQLLEDHNSIKTKMMKMITNFPKINVIIELYKQLILNYIHESRYYKSQYYECRFGQWLNEVIQTYAIPDTMHGGCEDTVEINNTIYARLYIDFIIRIHNFSQYVPISKLTNIMEIGGGFGAWPHLMLTMFPNIKKVVYIDIPPMIYIATQYLKHHFGNSVIDYSTTRKQHTIEFTDHSEMEILCLCPWQIEHLNVNIDLLWNSASFSEMTPNIVQNYAAHFKQTSSKNSHVCLILNKTKPHLNHKITLPNEVIHAFSPEFKFENIEPKLEHKSHSQYYYGHN